MDYDLDTALGDIYEHPAGKDVIDKLALQTGMPKWLIFNPVVDRLNLKALRLLSFRRVDDNFLDAVVDLLNTTPTEVAPAAGEPQRAWWKEAVFYQVYPRSFQDSDGDGVGDLAGITTRLDYLHSLGVGGLWLSPIFDSPNDDNGYDIRDYRKIMTEFGTLADFDALVTEAHARGIKVILDLVVNHTSDEHEWFQEALADPESPYRDYYFFAPGQDKARGKDAPNNWTSFFTGPAWRYFPEQDVWALHLFSEKQMDLNWDNPQVREEAADIARFWLDRGVDGFRLDVINYISKREGLPEGSPLIGGVMGYTGVENYFYGPHLHDYLAELNREAFAPAGAFSVGETPGVGNQMGKLLTDPERKELDLVFGFDHLETPGHVRLDDYRYDLNYLKEYYSRAQAEFSAQYWMALFFENHDNPRMISKVNPDPVHRERLGKLLGGILLTLRGTPFLYQGEELGMVNQAFPDINALRDVESLNLYREIRKVLNEDDAFARVLPGTRDHARTPMPWDDTPAGGFTTGVPWISGDEDYKQVNVQGQEANPGSVLNFYRELIAWRKEHPEFIYGETVVLDGAEKNYWAYTRGEEYLVQMNLSDEPLQVLGTWLSAERTKDAELVATTGGGVIGTLDPYELRIWRVAK